MEREVDETSEGSTLPEDDLLEVARYALKTGDESVTEQYQEVQSVRLRASFLITVNALSATFFGQLSAPVSVDLFLSFAVGMFVLSNVFCVLLMMPSGTWRITKSGGEIIDTFATGEHGLSAGKILSILAIKTDEDQVKNELIVRQTHDQFFAAAVCYAASTVAWLFHTGALLGFVAGG
ncbi:hypothetical protein HKCCE4037_15060 [Rhodobacterales bacterium HKCCE4037]|nr:hypothetical protein [Rhodobacterales bacterium HKCCE4037]